MGSVLFQSPLANQFRLRLLSPAHWSWLLREDGTGRWLGAASCSLTSQAKFLAALAWRDSRAPVGTGQGSGDLLFRSWQRPQGWLSTVYCCWLLMIRGRLCPGDTASPLPLSCFKYHSTEGGSWEWFRSQLDSWGSCLSPNLSCAGWGEAFCTVHGGRSMEGGRWVEGSPSHAFR